MVRITRRQRLRFGEPPRPGDPHADDLRAWRVERLRISKAELAILLGVPRVTVTGWENGYHGIRHWRILERALRDIERELADAPPERPRRSWTDEEQRYLGEHEGEGFDVLAAHLGRSPTSVQRKLARMREHEARDADG